MAARRVMSLRGTATSAAPPAALYKLMRDPVALASRLNARGLEVHKLPHADRWTLKYPGKLGQRVIDLRIAAEAPPDTLTWVSAIRGYEVTTYLSFDKSEDPGDISADITAEGAGKASAATGGTHLGVECVVMAVSLRARLASPLVKLAEKRARKALRKGVNRIAGLDSP